MKKLVLLTIFLPFIYKALCQYPEIHFEWISEQQGLNDNTINCLFQDSRGFIWIGGSTGLYRFDGYDFVYYKNPPGCKNCPPFYPVSDIVEDNQGMLWTISPKGIFLYDPAKEISRLAYRFTGTGLIGGHIDFDENLDLMKDSRF